MGYVLRMSNRNGLSGIHWLYKLLARDKLNHLKYEDTDIIAKLFGAKRNELNRAIGRAQLSDGIRMVEIHGQVIMRSYFVRTLRPQLCPYCISEYGYVKAAWDFSMACYCPIHQCALIDTCPVCAKEIRWMRPSLDSCNCGASWTNSRDGKLQNDQANAFVSDVINHKLNEEYSKGLQPVNALDPALSSLSLDTIMRLIWACGIRPSSSDHISTGISREILSTEKATSCCRRGYERLLQIFNQPDVSAENIRTLHLSALHALKKEAISTFDNKFMETLLLRIDPNYRKRTTCSTSIQLSLW